jgi:hypothetical protein
VGSIVPDLSSVSISLAKICSLRRLSKAFLSVGSCDFGLGGDWDCGLAFDWRCWAAYLARAASRSASDIDCGGLCLAGLVDGLADGRGELFGLVFGLAICFACIGVCVASPC